MRRSRTYIMLCLLLCGEFLYGQYFGRNKVQYDRFDFQVMETPDFSIYHYVKDSQNIQTFGSWSEEWYARHKKLFKDTISGRSPIILYNNHADFLQTTVIESLLGTSTSGVTEGYRNRIVMPFLQTNRETWRVLGHEMVHVFQYRMFKNNDSLALPHIMYVPLWYIEGMAEYLSLGSVDGHTAMWMRDAVARDDIPSIRDMTRNMAEYFPYRYGHAFLVYLTSRFGDEVLPRLLINFPKYGTEKTFEQVLGVSADSLSIDWANAMKDFYIPFKKNTTDSVFGELLFNDENAGELNISPAISPDGEKMIFISDRDVITLDFYLADVGEKKIDRKITSTVQKAYVDEFKYLGSSGTWAPDNRHFAIISFVKGKNNILIYDTKRRRIQHKIEIPTLDAFSNLDWSDDGKSLVLSGLMDGQTDLYLYHLETGELEQLTNDPYSNIQPKWAPDGSQIVFVSDRSQYTDFEKNRYGDYRICLFDMKTKKINVFYFFLGADNVEPHFSKDGQSIFFLSDSDGYRNLYEYKIDEQIIYKKTNFYTGISGVTFLSPSISITANDEIVYTLYQNKKYSIAKVSASDLQNIQVSMYFSDRSASYLPGYEYPENTFVTENLKTQPINRLEKDSVRTQTYKPRLSLEYMGSPGVGAGMSSFNTSFYGAVQFLFSDVLKQNQIYTALQINGEIQDIGGAIYYINKMRRINFGIGYSHIPYRFFGYFFNDEGAITAYSKNRIYIDDVSLFGNYPISKNMRFELGGGFTRYGFSTDSLYYEGGVWQEKKLDNRESYFYYTTYIAMVGDNSHFGFTSPLHGHRYRIQVDHTYGKVQTFGVLIDGRKYFHVKPLSFAFRALHFGKYNRGTDWPYRYFLGDHFYYYAVRGYFQTTFMQNVEILDEERLYGNSLMGTKIGLFNAEIRYPLIGYRRLSLFSSRIFYADLIAFFDAGLIWDKGLPWQEQSRVKFSTQARAFYHTPVTSVGFGFRYNLFGMLILEPYYAFPFQDKTNRDGIFGLTFTMGGW